MDEIKKIPLEYLQTLSTYFKLKEEKDKIKKTKQEKEK